MPLSLKGGRSHQSLQERFTLSALNPRIGSGRKEASASMKNGFLFLLRVLETWPANPIVRELLA
jgi:hypothetical protein